MAFRLLHLFVPSLLAAAALGCGEGRAESTGGPSGGSGGTGGAGAGSTWPAGGSGGMGDTGLVPVCQGDAVLPTDLPVSGDGTSVVVACAGHEISVKVLDPAIVRIAYDLAESPRPSYAALAQPPPSDTPLIGGTPAEAVVCTEEIKVVIDRTSCRLRATDKAGVVILESPEAGEGVTKEGLASTARWSAAPGERYYGFGEKTGALDKRGRKLVFYNTDAYDAAFGGYAPDADPLYASVPFFIGLRGESAYGLFFDNTHRLTFDMAGSNEAEWSVVAAGGAVDQYLFAGPDIARVVERYTRLTGRIPLPPRWSLGYHQSRWGYSPDTKVVSIADELRSRKIPADAMWLDIQHMDGFRSFTWDPVTFPDPEGLVSGLTAKGFRTVAIVDPAIKVDPAWDVYSTGVAEGHFLKDGGGQPYVGEVWPGASVFPDFSDPATRQFWAALVPRTLEKGVSGLWIDMNEPSNFTGEKGGTVPDELAAAGDGLPTTMAEMHNVYAMNEAQATYDGMRAASPGERPFVLTRAGYAGIQRYAAMWTGDAPSSWATLQTTLPMLLGMGLSGLTFSGSDVGGYSGFASPELYARWMQVGSFSPFFRNHVATGTNDQEPWQFGTEVTDISRAVIEERYRLMPYLYSLFREASRTGAPVLRPLVYEFQSDPATHDLGDEVMLGPFVLLAPVLTEGATQRAVYLPPGRWFEARSGAIHEGAATVDLEMVLGALPTFVREGAIVPRRDLVQWAEEKPIQTLYLDVYPAAAPSSFALYEDDGHTFDFETGNHAVTRYTTQRSATGATLSAGAREGTFSPAPRSLEIRVRRVDHAPTAVLLSGAAMPAFATEEAFSSATQGYFYDARDLSIIVRFPDPGPFDLSLEYDPSITDPAPPVEMRFEVTVPAGTPTGAPIHFASSASGWTHQPLEWLGPDKAGGLVSVPRGQYVFYKYTRGGWETVEKWPGCVEATNRYELGAAHPTKVDTVWAWADLCP